jgi:hypothetical protein
MASDELRNLGFNEAEIAAQSALAAKKAAASGASPNK